MKSKKFYQCPGQCNQTSYCPAARQLMYFLLKLNYLRGPKFMYVFTKRMSLILLAFLTGFYFGKDGTRRCDNASRPDAPLK